MGYYIRLLSTSATMSKENFARALELSKQLQKRKDLMRGGSTSGEKWFSWMNDIDFDAIKSMPEMFGKWRLHCREDNDRLYITHFSGEKIGQEDELFKVLGHLMEGELVWEGEDGARWKDSFSKAGYRRSRA